MTLNINKNKFFKFLKDRNEFTSLFSDPESPRRVKLKKLTRELSSVRRKLEELENEFENSPGGYRLSHVEKNKHKPMRKLLNEQSRLKRQIR